MIGFLIEHFAGSFPVWLSPDQVKVIPITDAHNDYAVQLAKQMQAQGIRAEADLGAERMNAKIRQAQLFKVPYMLVVGDREMAEGDGLAAEERRHAGGWHAGGRVRGAGEGEDRDAVAGIMIHRIVGAQGKHPGLRIGNLPLRPYSQTWQLPRSCPQPAGLPCTEQRLQPHRLRAQ